MKFAFLIGVLAVAAVAALVFRAYLMGRFDRSYQHLQRLHDMDDNVGVLEMGWPPADLDIHKRRYYARAHLLVGNSALTVWAYKRALTHVLVARKGVSEGTLQVSFPGGLDSSIAHALIGLGRYQESLELIGERAEEPDDSIMRHHAVQAAIETGDDDRARYLLGLSTLNSDPLLEAGKLRMEGDFLIKLGDYPTGVKLVKRAGLAYQNLGTSWGDLDIGYCVGHLGHAALAQDDPARAVKLLSTAETLIVRIASDDRAGLSEVGAWHARALAKTGDYEQSARVAAKCMEDAVWTDSPRLIAGAHVALAEVARSTNEPEEARQHLEKAASFYQQIGAQRDLAETQSHIRRLQTPGHFE